MPDQLAIRGGEKMVTTESPAWPKFSEEDVAAAVDALRHAAAGERDYISASYGGQGLEPLEKSWAGYLGVGYVVGTNSGCAAIHIGLMAAGVKAGDEVITSPHTWGQTVSPILQTNAIPVFADIDAQTSNLNPQSIEAQISPYTTAILVPHLFGGPAKMDEISAIAKKHGLAIVEDCAQSDGAGYQGVKVGAWGDLGAFSIGSGKNLAAGDGGMVSTDDERLYELAILYGHHPSRQKRHLKNPALREYIDSCCYTYRMHPMSAVIANAQLPQLDEKNAWRRRNSEKLSGLLDGVAGISVPKPYEGAEHVYHLYAPTYNPDDMDGLQREVYVAALNAEGVGVGSYVGTPIYMRSRYQEREYFWGGGLPWSLGKRDVVYREGDCPVAEEQCKRELIMGGASWYEDCTVHIEQIAEAFKKVVDNLADLKDNEEMLLRVAGP